jgi:hypothetical protein
MWATVKVKGNPAASSCPSAHPFRRQMDKSRGYCLEMICADFLAGANLENESPEVLLQSAIRFFKFLPGEERRTFLHHVTEKAS